MRTAAATSASGPDRDDYVSKQLYFPDTAALITRLCRRNAGARRRNRVRAEQQFQGQAFLLAYDLGERCEGFGAG